MIEPEQPERHSSHGEASLATTFPNMVDNNVSSQPLHEKILAEAKRIEEDALYSSRGHFEAARQWSGVHLWIGVPTTVLAAVASVSAFNDHRLLAGITAGLVAAFSAVSTFLNPSERVHSHHTAGTQYSALRNQARTFHEIAIRTMESDEAAERVRELGAQRDDLNSNSPAIPRRAFERARKNIEAGEAAYDVDRMQ